MILSYTSRMLRETTPRLLGKFVWNFGVKGARTMQLHRRRMANGEGIPAFLFISVTNACNLNCLGCWVAQTTPPVHMPPETLHRILTEAKGFGSRFFGILGGEPLLYPALFDVLARHPDCYFQLFTNGTLITPDIAARMRALGNITPLLSVEGLAGTSDERRRGRDVYAETMRGLDICHAHRLITGVASSICKSNYRELVTETFLRDLIRRGAHYAWYYIYRPAGACPSTELALSPDEILGLRQFLVDIRGKLPILVVDAYWDHEGRALCPAVEGLSHHIGPTGDVEPCPPIQLAAENVNTSTSLGTLCNTSSFLRGFRTLAARQSRGCILMEAPGALATFAESAGARDTSGRGTILRELKTAPCLPSHHQPGREIPEKHWLYRIAKKNAFLGLGAYG